MFDTEAATDRNAAIIPLEFWSDHEQDKDGNMVLTDFVSWQKIGNPLHGGQGKIKMIQKHQPEVYEALKRHYEAWKKNEDVVVDGTPIQNWPVLTKQMAKILKENGFLSVEDFSKATEADLQRIGMGARSLREQANQYVSLKNGVAGTAGKITKLAEENEKLKEKLEEMNEMLNQLRKDSPKKRGRPPAKKQEEVEE